MTFPFVLEDALEIPENDNLLKGAGTSVTYPCSGVSRNSERGVLARPQFVRMRITVYAHAQLLRFVCS